MIRLNKLQVSDFQAFTGQHELVLQDGVYAIIGRNLDTGGSNGSGKTSLVRAIITGLMGPAGSELTTKELQSFNSDQNPVVTLDMTVNSKPLLIRRVIGGSLRVSYDGVELTGKNQDVQNKLFDILGLSANQLLFLTYKSQSGPVQFLSMKDVKRKELLSEFFNAERIIDCYEQARNELKQQESALKERQSQILVLRERLQGLDAQVNALQTKVNQFDVQEVVKIQNDLKESEDVLQGLRAEYTQLQDLSFVPKDLQELFEIMQKAQLDLVNKNQQISPRLYEIKTQADAIRQRMQAERNTVEEKKALLAKQISDMQFKLRQLQEQQRTVERAIQTETIQIQTLIDAGRELQISLDAHIRGDNKAICHACGQNLPADKQELHIQGLREKVAQNQQKIQQIQNGLNVKIEQNKLLQEQIDVLLRSIADTQQEQQSIGQVQHQVDEATLKQLELEFKSHQNELLQAQKEYEAAKSKYEMMRSHMVKEFNTKLSFQQEKINTLKRLLDSKQKECSQLQEQLKELESKRDLALKEHDALNSEINSLQEQVSLWTDVASVFHKNAFITYVFGELLPTLTQICNKHFLEIPITARFQIKWFLDGDGDFTNRVISYTLTDEYGHEINLEMLSGAERQILSMLIDISLDDLLAERIGVRLGFKIYDEQMSFVDGQYKEFLLEFLKRKYQNSTLLLIDHSSELNAAISHKIVVEKSNGSARILQ